MGHAFQKQLILQIFIACGIIGFFIAAIAFIGSDLSKRAEAIRVSKNQAEFERQALKALIALKEQEKRAEGYASYLNALIPSKDDLFGFRNQITEIGKQEKMVLGFKFGAENHATAFMPASINFQITATGPAQGFRKLVDRLESSNYFNKVESFDVAWSNKAGIETFTATVVGKVFYRG